MTSRFQSLLAVALVLCGCQQTTAPPQTAAPQGDRIVLTKAGWSNEEYSLDRYQCMQSSQQQTTRVTNGVSDSSQTTNLPLYYACMSTRGYAQRRASDIEKEIGGPEVRAALRTERDQALSAVCANPAYAAYFAKSPCGTMSITSQQMADSSRISPEVKAIFNDVVNALSAHEDELFRILRNGSPIGARRADLFMSISRPQNGKNERDLYNGTITWGTYNKRRFEIAREYSTAAAMVAR